MAQIILVSYQEVPPYEVVPLGQKPNEQRYMMVSSAYRKLSLRFVVRGDLEVGCYEFAIIAQSGETLVSQPFVATQPQVDFSADAVVLAHGEFTTRIIRTGDLAEQPQAEPAQEPSAEASESAGEPSA